MRGTRIGGGSRRRQRAALAAVTAAAAAAVVANAPRVTATTYNYTGGAAGTTATPVTGSWNSATSWAEGVVPVSANDTELKFTHTAGTASFTATDNITSPNPFQLNKLTYNGTTNTATDTLTFTGTPAPTLQFVADASNINPVISIQGSKQLTSTIRLSLAAPLTIDLQTTSAFFDNGAIDLGANTITVSGAGAAAQVQFAGGSGNTTNVLSGTGGLVINLTGGGLVASNAANSFSGGTVVTGGQYVASGSSNGTVTPVAGGGVTVTGFTAGPIGTGPLTFQQAGPAVVGTRATTGGNQRLENAVNILSGMTFFSGSDRTLTLNGPVTLGNATTAANTNYTFTVSGPTAIGVVAAELAGNIGDGGRNQGFTVAGTTGSLRLSGANTFTGDVTAGGTNTLLQLAGPTAGGRGNLTVPAGSRVSYFVAPTLAAGKAITVNSSATALGVLGVGYNGVPTFSNPVAPGTIGGVLALDNAATGTAITNPIDQSAVGNGTMYLGSQLGGSYTGAGALTPGFNNFYRLGGGGGTLTFGAAAVNVLTGTAAVQIGNGLTNGAGTVVFSAAQNYTGVTTINAGSTLSLGATTAVPSANTVTLNGGTLTLTVPNALASNLTLTTGVVNLNAAGAYGGTGLNTIPAGIVVNANNAQAYNGSANITVNTGGTLTTSVAGGTPFGTGTVTVAGALAAVGANGSLAGTPDVTNVVLRPGGTVNLGDGATANQNRVGDGQTVTLNDSTLALIGGGQTATAVTAETVGTVAFSGQSQVTVQRQNTANVSASLTANAFTRVNRGVLLIRGTNGALGGTTSFNNLKVTGMSATAIVPYVIDTTSVNTFAQYTANGFAPVAYAALPAAGTGSEIVDITGTGTTDLGSASRNILALRTAQSITGTGGATLTIQSGALNFNVNTGSISIAAPLIFGQEGIVLGGAGSTSTLSGKVSGPDGLTKFGGGVTILSSGSNDYVGPTTVDRGTLRVAAGGVLGNGDVLVSQLGVLDLQSTTTNVIPDAATVTLVSDGTNFGTMILANGVNETVGGLLLGGVSQPPGTYGGSSSAAANKLPTYFTGTGTGILTVVPEPGCIGLLAAGAGLLLARRRRPAI